MKQIIEFTAICIVSILLVIFASLYFIVNKRQKKLNALNNYKSQTDENITAEWAEQLQIMQVQLDLMCELSPAFTICFDYSRNCFSVSENGQIQLGYKKDSEDAQEIEIDQKSFENLIHPDDMFIYEEVTEAQNIRKSELAESPYVIRLRQVNSQNSQNPNIYGNYLMRIKPVYSETGISAALIIAFINTEYLEDKNR